MNQNYGSMERNDPSADGFYSNHLVESHLINQERQEAVSPRTQVDQHSDITLEGVSKVQAIAATWSRKSIIFAYLGLYLLAFASSLEQQTTISLQRYATSNFSAHSNLASINLVSNILLAVVRAPMVKAGDVFGRTESLTLALCMTVSGYILLACSRNIGMFTLAYIIYICGQTGIGILSQLIIADTSSLLNRGILSAIPEQPYLLTVWMGPVLAQAFHPERTLGWRIGYGIWAIILPVVSLPLLLSLYFNQQKAKAAGLYREHHQFMNQSNFYNFWHELDGVGILLFISGFGLFLLPFSHSSRVVSPDSSILTVLSMGLGIFLLIALCVYDTKFADYPIFALRSLKDRTVLGACILIFLYFMSYFIFSNFLTSYLQVTHDFSIDSSGLIVNVFVFSMTTSAIFSGFLMKKFARFKILLKFSVPLYLLGLVGYILFGFDNENTNVEMIVFMLFLAGVGGGLLTLSAQVAVQSVSSHTKIGQNLTLYLTFSSVGGAFGSAVAGGVWSKKLPYRLLTSLDGLLPVPEIESIFRDLRTALSYPQGSHIRNLINAAYSSTQKDLFQVSLIFSVLMIIGLYTIRDVSLSPESRNEPAD
ncbi:siderophore-iron transporter Str2 [Schizosaccharomyces cryophilus OY26]|uniref:Siderophore-iron transporter Str2 n=1 Tax=Schizosaccharomyces cryophilus (strain OY26 / ATCC MYA-4695 / CBS 11777 / NBRC 106824 / NRRL Y48691) TaxID=653667 RepID=S9W0Z2_SCHCR|nr:siderophore-iron transporter Str2 [Schizosaccharomyces cryophilus OY26]EPY52119.1 siderophore-iron transporter Str2 [Schizosaccharomyces cryophilus OY26]